jgi:hypothetical protein
MTIGGPYTGAIDASYMAGPTIDDYADSVVLVDVQIVNNATAATSYQNEVLNPNGAVIKALTNNSLFVRDEAQYTPNFNLEVVGITDMTLGTFGGGTLTLYEVSSNTATPMALSGGGTYQVAQGSTVGAYGLSNSIFQGETVNVDGPSYGLIWPCLSNWGRACPRDLFHVVPLRMALFAPDGQRDARQLLSDDGSH